MLTGRRFELTAPTLILDIANSKSVATITAPVGAILKVVSGPSSERDRMVEVMWEGRLVMRFAIDLTAREGNQGIEISLGNVRDYFRLPASSAPPTNSKVAIMLLRWVDAVQGVRMLAEHAAPRT
jgi:hypothetical protein